MKMDDLRPPRHGGAEIEVTSEMLRRGMLAFQQVDGRTYETVNEAVCIILRAVFGDRVRLPAAPCGRNS
jgi:hypothetical protein